MDGIAGIGECFFKNPRFVGNALPSIVLGTTRLRKQRAPTSHLCPEVIPYQRETLTLGQKGVSGVGHQGFAGSKEMLPSTGIRQLQKPLSLVKANDDIQRDEFRLIHCMRLSALPMQV